ncbi:hypothetical protein V6U90_13530 [Micromonospora sp. CPCC 206060]|uniref:hypothetical protein n=1 Tax=Micromonospora sp. CPCC 206060 TaxID=3122406 RepID=UPI002FF22C34
MPALSRELVQRLYAAPPDGFVAARDAAVAAARAAGDAAGAREIAKLRKPTVAAWLVNLLAIRRPELITDLVELSTALRAAQRELRGDTLRELSGQRRALVGALVAEARSLAGRAEPAPPAGKLPLGEVEATLNAALSDVEVAEQVRSGRLIRAVSYAGFGEVPRPRLRLVTGGGAEPAPEPTGGPTVDHAAEPDRAKPARKADTDRAKADTDRAKADTKRAKAERKTEAEQAKAERKAEAERAKRRRALHRELEQARSDQERAEVDLDRARAAEQDAVEELAGLIAELAALERRRAAAEQEAGQRKLGRKGAERALTLARRRAGEVEAAVENLDREGAARGDGSGADSGG